MVTDLSIERLRREGDNAKLSPRDLVTLIADYLDKGEGDGKPVRMVAIIEFEHEERNSVESFRSGCTRYEEVALLALHHAKQVEDWRKS